MPAEVPRAAMDSPRATLVVPQCILKHYTSKGAMHCTSVGPQPSRRTVAICVFCKEDRRRPVGCVRGLTVRQDKGHFLGRRWAARPALVCLRLPFVLRLIALLSHRHAYQRPTSLKDPLGSSQPEQQFGVLVQQRRLRCGLQAGQGPLQKQWRSGPELHPRLPQGGTKCGSHVFPFPSARTVAAAASSF